MALDISVNPHSSARNHLINPSSKRRIHRAFSLAPVAWARPPTRRAFHIRVPVLHTPLSDASATTPQRNHAHFSPRSFHPGPLYTTPAFPRLYPFAHFAHLLLQIADRSRAHSPLQVTRFPLAISPISPAAIAHIPAAHRPASASIK
jgi:hypothetical protein